MKRVDKVYEYLRIRSRQLDKEDLKGKIGFSASEISKDLGIMRNNVSAELNALLREDRAIKINGRPVLFIDKNSVEEKLGYEIQNGPLEVDNLDELKSDYIDEERDPFHDLIGFKTGLKNQVEQAKAAILYPPNGIHTLILGETGVGKTLFVNMMYKYGKHVKRFKEESPFVVFNCADYYNNPQLLISHIFGHVKGAFTGADSEKDGIVQKADGGMLFLDEIHRLSPEGQEMIFYFMDTGTYNKLGETEGKRKANVLIVGATTEDPNSFLLSTFLRRIPIVITIPNFEKRPTEDKINILKYLLSNEAQRINKPIRIDENVIKAILGSTSYGNIGQMKSNIQLACAKGFLNNINNDKYIGVDFKSLDKDIKNGLFTLSGKRKEMEEISKYINDEVIIMPQGHKILVDKDPYEPPFNLYKIIEEKAEILKDEGLDEDSIKNFIATDINVHIRGFYDKFKESGDNRKKIFKIVDEDVFEFAENIKLLVEKELNKKFNNRFLYALSLHFSAFLKRAESHKKLKYMNIEGIIKDNSNEYRVSLKIKNLIEEKYKIAVPKMEVIYLTLLLNSIQETQDDKHVVIIVAAHGSSTASSMVNVVKKLLGDCNMEAIDMPLEVNPKTILDKAIEMVKEMDRGKGVLLMVDMGSLENFDTVIMEKTNIRVRTIDMVSTPLILEAARKTNIFDMSLDKIYEYLKDFRGYSRCLSDENTSSKKRAIITICSSGEGTAIKLKELVNDLISNITAEKIFILPVSIRGMKDKIKEFQEKFDVIALIGVTKPKVDIPFISLESIIDGKGEKMLTSIIKGNKIIFSESKKNVIVEDLCRDSLNEFLTYLNPFKIVSVLMDFSSVLEKLLNTSFKNLLRFKLIVHVGCALERMIKNEGIAYKGDKAMLDKNLISLVKRACNVFEVSLNITLTDDEIYIISEILK